jgi:glycosyltransferase involved in cell wall biosynthesis
MRVAHVITRMIIGGAQENTLYTCLDLMRLYGDDVLLVTGPQTGPEGSLLERAKGEGVPLAILPALRREIQPLAEARAYAAIKRTLRDFRPDVVHTHSAKGGVLGRAAAHALGVKAIIHTVHGAPFHPYQGRGVRAAYRAAERFAAKRCHAMVSVADAMTDLMVNAGVAPREKFTTIYSGMEIEPFLAADEHREAVRRELGFSEEHVVVGKIARLFHLKGHEYVIRAAGPVIARHPQVRFLFVGNGILREQLERQIAEAGLSEHFRFTGLVPPPRIPSLIGAMDILVHASLREGLARALPQALIAGKPAVSYDIDGAREVVIPGQTGYLLPPQSVEPMSEALSQLAGDPELRRRLGGEGRARFTDLFRHETMTRKLRELYEQTLAAGERGASAP